MGIVSSKLRASAKGQNCTIQIPGICNHDPETTVLAHAPSEVKGAATKSHDFHACFACYACHKALDNHDLEKWEEYFFWLRGLQRTQSIWHSMGILVVPEDKARENRSSKIVPRRHIATGERI